MISPPGTVSVCSGDQLELTCNITMSGPLEWSVNLIPENATNPMRYDRAISSSSPSDQTAYMMVNSIRFTFSRVSAQNTLPFVSRSLISPVSNGLNRTVVYCMDIITSETVSLTIIVIIGDLLHGKMRVPCQN